MTVRVFVETNVLIYARDRRDSHKRGVAAQWLAALGDASAGRVNLQVMNEFTRWLLRNEPTRALDDIRSDVDLLRIWGDRPVGHGETDLAWTIREATRFQWFDCLLLAAAELSGCNFFLTEDMIEGATIGSLSLINPFRTSPSDILSHH